MKPDSKKEKDQWNKLIEDARRSRQLSRIKRNAENHLPSKDASKKNRLNLKSQSNSIKNLADKNVGINQINQTSNSNLINNLSNDNEQINSISRLNNSPLNKIVDKFQNLMTTELDNERQQCRICFSNTEEQLFRPCNCKGTMSFSHRTCLSRWIKSNRSRKCNICLSQYKYLQITYQYPNIYKWLIEDIDTLKNFLLFLFFYSVSFLFYSKRTFGFYLFEYKNYLKEINLIKSNYFFDNLEFNNLNRLKFSKISMQFLNEMSNQIRNVSSFLSNPFNAYSLDQQSNCLNNSIFNHHCLTNQQQFESSNLNAKASNLADVNRLEQITYSVTIYTYFLLIYLFNDLAVIFMYEIVLFIFLLYFRKEFLIWRYENRIAEVEFLHIKNV